MYHIAVKKLKRYIIRSANKTDKVTGLLVDEMLSKGYIKLTPTTKGEVDMVKVLYFPTTKE